MWVPYKDFWALFTFSFLAARLADLGKKIHHLLFLLHMLFCTVEKSTFQGIILLIYFYEEFFFEKLKVCTDPITLSAQTTNY